MTSQTIQQLAERRAAELNHLVIEAVACAECPCGFNWHHYRSVLRWHATECIKEHRAAREIERNDCQHWQHEYAEANAGRMQSAVILDELMPCRPCLLKYNPTGRHRATLPDLRDPEHFLRKDELWTLTTQE